MSICAARRTLATFLRSSRFYEVYCEVHPKRVALEKANAELKAARDKLDAVNKQVAVRSQTFSSAAKIVVYF